MIFGGGEGLKNSEVLKVWESGEDFRKFGVGKGLRKSNTSGLYTLEDSVTYWTSLSDRYVPRECPCIFWENNIIFSDQLISWRSTQCKKICVQNQGNTSYLPEISDQNSDVDGWLFWSRLRRSQGLINEQRDVCERGTSVLLKLHLVRGSLSLWYV
jgi:hypothetical protein